ncbi:MAG: TM1812 family CRISPR-associated protein [Phascolarctobacterium sp.]|uniref:TM1812 family CRISPR-associated protein n=1 Tax=Phascolarctobacterium sp. TaxID=2049039 RepID=UPI0026DCF47D|nr:TM1812 family CRISPR-associated protein [Phascolarctobacterium sp.]MDO4922195.1 TM1812 family CRISPR-associated protein [Phascolarctobacterium sp.]
MRKVFVSVMLLGKLNPTDYVSEDFELSTQHFDFPLSYIINNEVQEGDEVEIITAVEHGSGSVQQASDNYAKFHEEVNTLLSQRQAKVHFEEIAINKEFEAETFTKFFKEITLLVRDNDLIYTDVTFGMKVYTLSMFIALAYAVKAAVGAEMRCVLYSQKYTGTDAALDKNTSKLCDVTSLFYLNAIAGNAKSGQKQDLDKLFDIIISE